MMSYWREEVARNAWMIAAIGRAKNAATALG